MKTNDEKITNVGKNKFTALRALRHKNFRLYFSGQSISVVGTWVQRIALVWLVYQLTNSALILGIVGFAGQIPLLFVTPFAGVFADRLNKHKIILYSQMVAMFQAVVLSILVFTNLIQVWEIILLSIFLGIIDAIDMPTRQSFMVEMIGKNKDDIGSAIALNSSMVNAARLVGPAVAGVLISAFGEGWCFLLNGISYVAVIFSLIKMEIKYVPSTNKKEKAVKELKEGFKYAFGFAPIKYILLLLAVISFMGTPIRILAPLFAKEILHGGADTFGFLMGASGLGALIGAITLLNKKSVLGLGKLIAFSAGAFGIGVAAFALSTNILLSMFFMLLTGMGMMIQMAGSNTLLQTIVEDNKRGRVMSFYAMSFRGVAPFGSLAAGALAGIIGAPMTLIIGGIFSLAASILFFIKLPQIRILVRPIYAQLGIINPNIESVGTATNLTFQEKE